MFQNLHPEDLLFFNEVVAAMKRVAREYDLPLRNVTPMAMPAEGMADRMGDCSHDGNIRIVMRCTVNGEWCDAPMSPNEVWDTASHELAHLRHFNHGAEFNEFWTELHEAIQNKQVDHKAKLIDKLVKMQRQRESEAKIGNTAAAEAFAGAINRLLIEHELNPSELDYARATDSDPVIEMRVDMAKYRIKGKRTRIAWQETLARVVARAHLCQFLLRKGSNQIWFVGTRSHATVAEYVFGTLVPAVETMATHEYWRFRAPLKGKGNDESATHGFKSSWITAFIQRVDERFEIERKAAVKNAAADVPGAESMALIRLSGALAKVNKYVDDKFSGRSGGVNALATTRISNAEGAARGRAAADRLPIGRRGVEGGKGVKGLLS